MDRSTRRPSAVGAFVAAWERSRTATFVASGSFERRSTVTGARIASPDVLAQRPPQRLHRQLGGVDGRNDDRLLVCPAAPTGDATPPTCRLGTPGERTYAASVASEVAALRTIVGGERPVYAVRSLEPGCFALDQLRVEPRAPFGRAAQFCFDGATGAPRSRRVEYDAGIVEVLSVTTIRTTVRDADLAP